MYTFGKFSLVNEYSGSVYIVTHIVKRSVHKKVKDGFNKYIYRRGNDQRIKQLLSYIQAKETSKDFKTYVLQCI